MKKALGLLFFGTTVSSARSALDAIKADVSALVAPDWLIAESYSSAIIRRKLARAGTMVDTPFQMCANLAAQGVTHLFLQPALMMPGYEYDDFKGLVAGLSTMTGKYSFDTVALGRPLMTDGPSTMNLAQTITTYYERVW